MSHPGRKRASLLLLLVLAAGLALAGAAAAASAQDMACCPAGMESAENGCTWLGAGDCCFERPSAQAPANAAPPAAHTGSALALPAFSGAPVALLHGASQARFLAPRAPVLRL